ncbi:MAG TPA: CopL family metal-binding regulatory protein [Lysobacter sp.]
MSPRAVLIHLLLCISLVLNGSAYAVASTQMHRMHAAAATAMATTALPCHDTHGSQHAGMHASADTASTASACHDSEDGRSAPDCCKSTQCSCDCLQHATATLAGISTLPAVIAGASVVRAMSPDHAAPTLASPIRPPIV